MMYTTHLEILSRLRSTIRNKPIYEADVLMWCQILEVEILADERFFYRIIRHPLKVHKGYPPYCEVPPNVHRIVDIYLDPKNRHTRFDLNLKHISFNTGEQILLPMNFKGDTVYIDYWGMPFMEEPPYYPLILKGHELACEAYCKFRLFEEDILYGRVNAEYLIQTRDAEILAAKAATERFKTISEKDRVQMIMKDMVPNYGRRPFMVGAERPVGVYVDEECENEGIGYWIIESPVKCLIFVVS